MSVKSRLDKLYKTCDHITLPKDAKILFISDLHLNNGGPTDDFKGKEDTLKGLLKELLPQGYYVVILGDWLDLWEEPKYDNILWIYRTLLGVFEEYREAGRLIVVRGNHDRDLLEYPEAVILEIGDIKIFCVHGHQGDWANDTAWWWGKYFVRYVWVPLQWIGLHDPTVSKRKKHLLQASKIRGWAADKEFLTSFGHVHEVIDLILAGCFSPGSWVGEKGEGWEFKDGQFEQKTWG